MSSLEVQIQKLEKTLLSNEAYINYLEKEISNRDEGLEELEILRKNNMSLQKRLKKAFQDITYKEETLVILESRVLNLDEEISRLKNRICEISSRKYNTKDILNMAQQPNQHIITNNFNIIHREMGNIRVYIQNPNLSNLRPNNILTKIGMISTSVRILEDLIQNSRDTQTITRLQRELKASEDEKGLLLMAHNNERENRRQWYYSYKDKHRRVGALIREKFASKLLIRNYRQQLQQYQNHSRNLQQKLDTCQNDLFLSDIQIDIKWGKWKNRSRNYEQIITNLNQNILNLQNNIANQPHMAAIHEIYQILHSPLSQIPNYIGKEPPDEYYQKIINVIDSINTVITTANTAHANTFTDAHRCDILKGKMGEKFSPVPVNDGYTVGNPVINTPATFQVWFRHKYREVTAGNPELALQALMQEKFNPLDTPDTYEARIRKIIVGFQDVIVIPALYTHLPPDLRSNVKMYMSIRGANTTIDNFFADLKKCWLERQSGNNSTQPTLINQQQPNNALDILANFAQRLGYSGNLTDYNQMQKYIENDLYRNYGGRQVQNIKNEPFEQQRKIYATKQPAPRKVIITNKNSRQCSICKKVRHTKINCPKVKRVRRLNNISQYENNENDENEEYFVYVDDDEEIIDADNEEVILEDDENEYSDFEPQETNCFNIKKKETFLGFL